MPEKNCNGFLLIDKPAGISSFDVIRQLRRQTGIRTFGHAGTLDPFATGLLIIAVNKYTRLLPLLDNADKTYIATMEFGKATTTADPEGEVTALDDTLISEDDVRSIIDDILAIETMQPPKYSALKVDGQRAYALARKGDDFELPVKPMRVHEFSIESYDYPHLLYQCRVSKGTYIRALSEWIASRLNTVGYTKELRRTAIGKLNVAAAAELESVTGENISTRLCDVTRVCPELATVTLESPELAKLSHGNPAFNPGINENPVLVLNPEGICCGIGYREDNLLYPKVNI